MKPSVLHVALLVTFAGVAMLALSTRYEPFKPVHGVSVLHPDDIRELGDMAVAQEQWYATWNSRLTLKYPLQDYATTCLAGGIILLSLLWTYRVRRWSELHRFTTPNSIAQVQAVGVVAAMLTGFAGFGHFMVGYSRGELPAWADTPGISMFGGIFAAFFLLLPVAIFAMLGTSNYQGGAAVYGAFCRKTRPRIGSIILFGIPLALSLAGMFRAMAAGDVFYTLPAMLWVLFFVFLLAGRQRPGQEQSARVGDGVPESKMASIPSPPEPADETAS